MCGIFGIIGKEKQRFDKLSFCGLGVKNDIRGGDSTGISIDGKLDYGVDDNKLFANFCFKSNLIRDTKNAKIAIGHCRKASVGAVNLANAHPIVIHNKQDEKIRTVTIHNGTILNHVELAEKYLDIEDPSKYSDSTLMAWLFYRIGPRVFKEYNGAGAFVIVDYRDQKQEVVYVFKGKSKNFNTEHSIQSEERPLYWVKTSKGIWFSSTKDSLKDYVIFNDNFDCEIEDVPCNTLFTIVNGEIISQEEIDRSENYQTVSQTVINGVYGNTFGYGGYNNSYSKKSEYKNNAITLSYHESETIMEGLFDIDFYSTFLVKGDVSYIRGRYVDKDEKALTGIYKFSPYGFVTKYEDVPEVCFYNGIMLSNKQYYYDLTKLQCDYELTEDGLEREYPEILYSLSNMPKITSYINSAGSSFYQFQHYFNYKKFDLPKPIKFPILYDTRYYEVNLGINGFIGALSSKAQLNTKQYREVLEEYYLDSYDSNILTYESMCEFINNKKQKIQ